MEGGDPSSSLRADGVGAEEEGTRRWRYGPEEDWVAVEGMVGPH